LIQASPVIFNVRNAQLRENNFDSALSAYSIMATSPENIGFSYLDKTDSDKTIFRSRAASLIVLERITPRYRIRKLSEGLNLNPT
jgi:hypothetical protein